MGTGSFLHQVWVTSHSYVISIELSKIDDICSLCLLSTAGSLFRLFIYQDVLFQYHPFGFSLIFNNLRRFVYPYHFIFIE